MSAIKQSSRNTGPPTARIILALMLMALLVVNVIVTHNLITEPAPGHNDFMSRWEGARSFFIDGLSPYSDEASLNIQKRIFGRAVEAGEDPGLFVYPFYTALLIAPTVFVSYPWASAIWMVVLEVCLVAALLLLLDLYRWRPRPITIALLILWSLGDYYAARGLLLGQPSHVVYLMQIIAIWGLFKSRDGLAGAALAISTIKPQMGYLFVPFLLLWALRARRWRFIGMFTGVFGVLMLISFILEPAWFGDWLAQVRLYPQYTSVAYPDTGSPVWIIMQHYLGLGHVGEWALNLVILVPMAWAWFTVLVQRRDERLLWAIVVTLMAGHMVALRTATPHYVVFNLAIFFYLAHLSRRRKSLSIAAIMAGSFILTWLLFIITVQGRDTLEHPLLFLPLPIILYVLVWVTRGLWWHESPSVRTITPEPGLSQKVLSHDAP